ncbi:MAG TPA: arsenite methyltransferase [Symbiobacteriaceae bacterium]|nr:arsenite methyltransferase [Symbiobacteriaceae bacterium]
MDAEQVKSEIRLRYGAAASKAANSGAASCCDTSCCSDTAGENQITGNLYQIDEVSELPPAAVLASLGCGNPTALAELHPGEVVLDLGSGGGIDVLLSARRVGPTGKAYGLDMTDEMLALAEKNKAEAGATNVTFLKGDIEAIPLPDSHVDVIISNCVINLSTDKDKVFAEAFRVLKPGGRFAVSDIVFRGEPPQSIRQSLEAIAGCIGGALEEQDYIARLTAAGFTDASIQVTRVYEHPLLPTGTNMVSGFVRARKPGGQES